MPSPCCGNGWNAHHSLAVPWSRGVGPVVGCLPCYHTAHMGVILMQIIYTDNGMAGVHSRMPVLNHRGHDIVRG